jgi:transposase
MSCRPAGSRFERTETEEQACGSLDWISTAPSPRRSPGTTASSNGLGRVDMRRPLLEAFAKKLSKEDVVVVEATGNAASVTAAIAPHVKQVVIANPKQVRVIAHAKIKTDTIDASVLAQLYASGFLPEVWIPNEPTQELRRHIVNKARKS